MFLVLVSLFTSLSHAQQSTIIVADGQPHSVSMPGRTGSSGSSGWDGSDAHCFSSDHFSKRGGDGRDGGRGGTGGAGGDSFIYYSDIANLSQIFINAPGGRGGSGGRGGRGGRGCNGGFSGSSGMSGSTGFSGNEGKVYLIENLTELPETKESQSVKIADLEALTSFKLSRKIWKTIDNPAQYLRVGSIVDSVGYKFAGVNEVLVDIEWDAPSSPKDSADADSDITATLDSKGKVTFTSSGNTSLVVEKSISATGKVILRIKKAFLISAINDLSDAKITGTAPNLFLEVRDNKGLSDVAKTHIQDLKIDVKGFIGHRVLFNSDRDYIQNLEFTVIDPYTLRLPLRGIMDTALYEKRKNAKVSLVIERTYGFKSTHKTLTITKGNAI